LLGRGPRRRLGGTPGDSPLAKVVQHHLRQHLAHRGVVGHRNPADLVEHGEVEEHLDAACDSAWGSIRLPGHEKISACFEV